MRAMAPLTLHEPTPCGALFDILKRHGGISHRNLASMILSERQLSDGRSALSRASDRSWVSHFVVHAPVGSLQPGYFRDWGVAAQRVMGRLRARSGRRMTNEKIIGMVCGEQGMAMERALAACRQDVRLYRNALTRLTTGKGYTTGERAEAVLVLFVAVGCSANVPAAVAYTMDYVTATMGGRMGTPEAGALTEDVATGDAEAALTRPLGLIRVEDGYLAGAPHWVDPASAGAEIGILALGAHDITDVEADVSEHHAAVRWDDADSCWKVRDLGSTNGTAVVSALAGEEHSLAPGEECALMPGDELRLGSQTVFAAIEGVPGVLDEAWS